MDFKDKNRSLIIRAIEELENLQADGFKWVARDEDAQLFAHDSFPYKRTAGFREGHGEWYGRTGSSKFCSVADGHSPAYTDVLWEDEESTGIRDLLTSLRREIGEDPVPDDSPDDAPLAVVEGPDDSNRSIYTPVTQTVDNVNHPAHYKHGEIETLDIIRMSLTAEEFQGFLKGNVLKYQMRAPHKHETPDEDYKKAKFYYDEYREGTE